LLPVSFSLPPPSPTAPSPLSLHDALPICPGERPGRVPPRPLPLPAGGPAGPDPPGRPRQPLPAEAGGGTGGPGDRPDRGGQAGGDRKSTRLNSSHVAISYAVFCLKKKTQK